MWGYALRRIAVAIPTVLGALTAVFFILRIVPGDPALAILGEYATAEAVADLRARMGLDAPLPLQYVRFLGGVLTGDLGRSVTTNEPVLAEIARVLPGTATLAFTGLGLAVLIGVPAGVLAAVRRNRATDYLLMSGSLLGLSMPSFWLGILLLIVFAVQLGWFPVVGSLARTTSGQLQALVLPALTLGLSTAGMIARMTRSSVLEVLNQDYVRTARAKGLHERVVVYRHALRNALIPIVTVVGLNLGYLLGGTVVVETLFVRAGLGQLLVGAILSRDYPQVEAAVGVYAVVVITINLLVDLAYGYLDPVLRTKLGAQGGAAQ